MSTIFRTILTGATVTFFFFIFYEWINSVIFDPILNARLLSGINRKFMVAVITMHAKNQSTKAIIGKRNSIMKIEY